jgi:5'-methylthioadenosine phosphorylase
MAFVLHERGTLVCMEGAQFSTRAESNLYRSWGGRVINLSALPEAKQAREAEIAYQRICMAADYDCWHATNKTVHVEVVMAHMKANSLNARRFVGAVLDELSKVEHDDLVAARHLTGQSKLCISTAPAGVPPQALEGMKWLFPESYTTA